MMSDEHPSDNPCHIYPVGDIHEHMVNGDFWCWCKPVLTIDNIVVHNAMDGREYKENPNMLN